MTSNNFTTQNINRHSYAAVKYQTICTALICTMATVGISAAWLDIAGLIDINEIGGIIMIVVYIIFAAACVTVGCMLWHFNKGITQYTKYQKTEKTTTIE